MVEPTRRSANGCAATVRRWGDFDACAPSGTDDDPLPPALVLDLDEASSPVRRPDGQGQPVNDGSARTGVAGSANAGVGTVVAVGGAVVVVVESAGAAVMANGTSA